MTLCAMLNTRFIDEKAAAAAASVVAAHDDVLARNLVLSVAMQWSSSRTKSQMSSATRT